MSTRRWLGSAVKRPRARRACRWAAAPRRPTHRRPTTPRHSPAPPPACTAASLARPPPPWRACA
eukprot:119655-Prymnesium_polylepis.1